MPQLHELQSTFSGAVFQLGHAQEKLMDFCAGPHSLQGIQAYRNSVVSNLAGAVRCTYPVVERIVGTAFLNAAISRYVLETPSRSGNLNNYGEDFCDFLATYEPASTLPYLRDVARVEWQVQCMHDAFDSPVQDLTSLVQRAPTDWADMSFLLDGAHHVIQSRWPVATIWKVNQEGYCGDFSLDFEKGEAVLIHRRGNVVALEALTPGELVFLQLLAEDCTLIQATTKANEFADADFDLQATLARFIQSGLIRQALHSSDTRS